MIPQHLQPMLDVSIVKTHEGHLRRYFPLTAKVKRGMKWIHELFFIVYGRKAKDDFEAQMAVLTRSIDLYVEKFDDKLWVRTICVH